MNGKTDRLYDLLPVIYKLRDEEQLLPLKSLMRVIAEQVNVVEEDIAHLYDNWFIETSDDWVVPYIADLVGYEPVHEAGEPGEVTTEQDRQRNKILIPRTEVANTIRNRRRKGTLALLELLSFDVAKWPARAVEFFPLVSITQPLNHLRFSEPTFKITEQTLENLKEDGLPEELVNQLTDLLDLLISGDRKFLDKVELVIGEAETAKYKDFLLLRSRFAGKTVSRGKTVDLRNADALGRIDGPFDEIAHTVDVRRPNSRRTPGRYNIPSIGLFVWRLTAFRIRQTVAYNREGLGYTFSILGNDIPLYTRSVPEEEPTEIAGELNLPIAIRRQALQENKEAYYGEDKSLHIWKDGAAVPISEVVVADLSAWTKPDEGFIAVDPVLGRMTVNDSEMPTEGLRVTYHYGFSADIGGGEYFRVLQQPTLQTLGEMCLCEDDIVDHESLVSKLTEHETTLHNYIYEKLSPQLKGMLTKNVSENSIAPALKDRLLEELNDLIQGECIYDKTCFAEVELPTQIQSLISTEPPVKSNELLYLNRVLLQACFDEELQNVLIIYQVGPDQEFENINAAIEQWHDEDKPRHAIMELQGNEIFQEPLEIDLKKGQTLQIRAENRQRPVIRQLDWKAGKADAILIKGEEESRFTLDGILVTGRGIRVEGNLEELNIRHCTLVPGWDIGQDCEPAQHKEHSIVLSKTETRISVQHSIVGSISVIKDEVESEPALINISDSILDATQFDLEALSRPDGNRIAHAILTIKRTTVLGKVLVHAIDLGENCIFSSEVCVARRQIGCLRFSYVSPESRTPKRFNCQPDLVVQKATDAGRPELLPSEETRVIPQFNSIRYGMPTYCQLTFTTAEEIRQGADDESEMGAFHDLFQPQREANIRTRLQEYTPAGMNAGVFFVT